MKKIIKTSHLIIKPYEDIDQIRLAELLTNKEIKKTVPITDCETEKALSEMVTKLQNLSRSDDHFERGIYLDALLIGSVYDVEIDNDAIELGYLIHPACHNKGYATEMLRAVIQELLHDNYSTITACAFEENHASIQVMKKSGMKKTNKEKDIDDHGVKRHCVYYAISKKQQ